MAQITYAAGNPAYEKSPVSWGYHYLEDHPTLFTGHEAQ